MRKKGRILWSVLGLVTLGLLAGHCAPSVPKGAKKAAGAVSDVAVAAQKTYIAPGDLDEYYLFSSGGHSGQIYVYGVPSMRHLSTIPVFSPYPATGYGFDDDSRAMLGNLFSFVAISVTVALAFRGNAFEPFRSDASGQGHFSGGFVAFQAD